MSVTVFCTATPSQAETIVNNLMTSGFSGDDISVLMADQQATHDLAIEHNTKAPEGAISGAGGGAVLGGALGWFAGIGALAIPGLGPFIAAGPILAALGGAAVGGAVGGLAGALVGMGLSEFEAKQYEGKVKGGNALISIQCNNKDDANRASGICERGGATDVTTSGGMGGSYGDGVESRSENRSGRVSGEFRDDLNHDLSDNLHDDLTRHRSGDARGGLSGDRTYDA